MLKCLSYTIVACYFFPFHIGPIGMLIKRYAYNNYNFRCRKVRMPSINRHQSYVYNFYIRIWCVQFYRNEFLFAVVFTLFTGIFYKSLLIWLKMVLKIQRGNVISFLVIHRYITFMIDVIINNLKVFDRQNCKFVSSLQKR